MGTSAADHSVSANNYWFLKRINFFKRNIILCCLKDLVFPLECPDVQVVLCNVKCGCMSHISHGRPAPETGVTRVSQRCDGMGPNEDRVARTQDEY